MCVCVFCSFFFLLPSCTNQHLTNEINIHKEISVNKLQRMCKINQSAQASSIGSYSNTNSYSSLLKHLNQINFLPYFSHSADAILSAPWRKFALFCWPVASSVRTSFSFFSFTRSNTIHQQLHLRRALCCTNKSEASL